MNDTQNNELKIFHLKRADDLIPLVRQLALEFHEESQFGHLPFSDEKYAKACRYSMRKPEENVALLVEYNGEIIGGAGAMLGDYYLAEGGRMVTVQAIYVAKKYRGTMLGGRVGVRLIRSLVEWGKSKGAQEIHINATSGIQPGRTDKMLNRMGFRAYGGNYAAKLS